MRESTFLAPLEPLGFCSADADTCDFDDGMRFLKLEEKSYRDPVFTVVFTHLSYPRVLGWAETLTL